MIFIDS